MGRNWEESGKKLGRNWEETKGRNCKETKKKLGRLWNWKETGSSCTEV